ANIIMRSLSPIKLSLNNRMFCVSYKYIGLITDVTWKFLRPSPLAPLPKGEGAWGEGNLHST
ncbi:MAG: hypothetical protein ACK5L1_12185, partial [Pseudanabaena sp.]